MQFRTLMDDLLPTEAGEALGRLLIEYQQFESVISASIDVALEPIDPLGLINTLWAAKLTSARKIETVKKVLNVAAEAYGVPSEVFNGTFPLRIPSTTADRTSEEIAQAFAAMRGALEHASRLLDERNDLFHGDLSIEGSEMVFRARTRSIPCDAQYLINQRQEVVALRLTLSLATTGLREALECLVRTHA
jgi:hypothetical protein